jgi:hypothetical protein
MSTRSSAAVDHDDAAVIRPLTAEARVTVKILRLNDADRVEERALILKRIPMS